MSPSRFSLIDSFSELVECCTLVSSLISSGSGLGLPGNIVKLHLVINIRRSRQVSQVKSLANSVNDHALIPFTKRICVVQGSGKLGYSGPTTTLTCFRVGQFVPPPPIPLGFCH